VQPLPRVPDANPCAYTAPCAGSSGRVERLEAALADAETARARAEAALAATAAEHADQAAALAAARDAAAAAAAEAGARADAAERASDALLRERQARARAHARSLKQCGRRLGSARAVSRAAGAAVDRVSLK